MCTLHLPFLSCFLFPMSLPSATPPDASAHPSTNPEGIISDVALRGAPAPLPARASGSNPATANVPMFSPSGILPSPPRPDRPRGKPPLVHYSTPSASGSPPPTSAPLSANPDAFSFSSALADSARHGVAPSPLPPGKSGSHPISLHPDDGSTSAGNMRGPRGALGSNTIVVVPALTTDALRDLAGLHTFVPAGAPPDSRATSPALSVSSIDSLLAGLPPLPTSGVDKATLDNLKFWYDEVADSRFETHEAKACFAAAKARYKAAKARLASAGGREEHALNTVCILLSERPIKNQTLEPGPSTKCVCIAAEPSSRVVRKRRRRRCRRRRQRRRQRREGLRWLSERGSERQVLPHLAMTRRTVLCWKTRRRALTGRSI